MYFPFPSASHASSLFISQVFIYGCRVAEIYVKSVLIYLRLCSTLRSHTEFFSSSQSPLFPYIWETCCFKSLDFWVYKNAEEQAPGKQYCNTFQSSGVFVTLQKFLVVSDIQLPRFPELALSSYILPHILRQVSWTSEGCKNEKSENIQQLQ